MARRQLCFLLPSVACPEPRLLDPGTQWKLSNQILFSSGQLSIGITYITGFIPFGSADLATGLSLSDISGVPGIVLTQP